MSQPTVRHYNPRTESPFPQVAHSQDKPPAFTTPHSSSTPTNEPGSSHGLFTPPKAVPPPREVIILKQLKTIKPQAQATDTTQIEMTKDEQRYDDDYILPVPEPLVLKPRPAGRPPPLSRQLERFPMPIGTLKRKNDLLHPAKLFQEVEYRASQSTVDTVGTPCPTPFSVRRGNLSRERSADTTHGNGHNNSTPPEPIQAVSRLRRDQTPKKMLHFNNTNETNPFLADSGNQSHETDRSGTVTKTRTPVAELREHPDGTSTIPTSGRIRVKAKGTPSVSPFDTPGDWSTPPTSPTCPDSPKISCEARISDQNPFADTQVKYSERSGLDQTSSSTTSLLREVQASVQSDMSTLANDPKRFSRSLIPARLNFKSSSHPSNPENRAKGRSMSSLSTLLKPILVQRIHQSHPVSSIYSRDTRGMSFLPTPTNDRFSQYHAVQPLSIIDARSAMSMGHVQSKIDQWDLHTADLDTLVSKSTKQKRTLSDCGSRGPNLREFPSSDLVQPLRIRPRDYEDTDNLNRQMPTRCSSVDMLNQNDDSGTKQRAHGHQFGSTEGKMVGRRAKSTREDAPGGVAWI